MDEECVDCRERWSLPTRGRLADHGVLETMASCQPKIGAAGSAFAWLPTTEPLSPIADGLAWNVHFADNTL
jgi:hypothetical protein